MICSESFAIRGLWVQCKNPASIIAKTFKHGDERGICSHCLIRLDKTDDSDFFDRHEFRGVDE